MIKFIEIYEESAGYDDTLGLCRENFSLRELYLNPRYVVSMMIDHRLMQKSKSGVLVDGLSRDADFTQLTVATHGHMPKIYNVVGSPDSLLNKIKGEK